MRSRGRLHATAIALAIAAVFGGAAGQRAAVPASDDLAQRPVDVPDHRPSPPRFAVAPFENDADVRAFDWLIAGAPFEMSEKIEDVLGLEPTGGSLHVGKDPVIPEPGPVAEFGAARGAAWVITGWFDRPRWKLRIGITLWKVTGRTATPAAEVIRQGETAAYHQIVADVLADAWTKAGIPVDAAQRRRLARPLATDLYAVNLMGRGLGYLLGLIGIAPGEPPMPNLKAAEHDLERAVFIDPKCYEAQRLVGELYLVLASDPKSDPRLPARAAGKFSYASDLAPDDIWSLRAASRGATRSGKHDVARDLLRKLVARKPWALDARHEYGAALWETGDAAAAQRQLEQVTAHQPAHLAARRVLVLIHASRGDTAALVRELEAIASRAPDDLEVRSDLAAGYGAIGRWDQAAAQLARIAAARPADVALLVRLGDAKRRGKDLPGALAVYARAQRAAPDSSYPAYAAAQALYDAGRLAEAWTAYTNLQRFRDDAAYAEQALGTIALAQGRANDGAWYMRLAVRDAPRSLVAWRTLATAEIARKDPRYALTVLERAFAAWPRDAELLYLAGVARAMLGERIEARDDFESALEAAPGHPAARAALALLDAERAVPLPAVPRELVRPWGDGAAIEDALERFAALGKELAAARAAYQDKFLAMLAVLGKGPYAPTKPPAAVRTCPLSRMAPLWGVAQRELRRYERAGADLEVTYRFIARHDDIGATAALLPNARAQVAAARRAFRTALADVGELRAEWGRSLVPELRAIGCSDKLLAAAVADPDRYQVIVEDRPVEPPKQQAPRPRPRATFYVDNTRCADAVDVFIDGAPIGQAAPGRRSALVADAGERTLCLIVPGGAQCGDRGTVRQVYLHNGWSTTMYCPT